MDVRVLVSLSIKHQLNTLSDVTHSTDCIAILNVFRLVSSHNKVGKSKRSIRVVHRIPNECGVPEYVRETWKRRRSWLNSGSRAVAKEWTCTLARETVTDSFHYIRSTVALNIATVQH
jgi:hypothetical protein